MRRLLQSLLLALLPFAAIAADPVPQTREGSLAGFRYLVFETGGVKPDDELPMIVGLHYSSAKPETMLEYFDGIDFPARIVLPQGEYPRRGGYSWFASDYADLSAAEQKKATFGVEEKLSAFVGSTAAKYPTRGKPVAMGISYGGDLALLLAIRHPDGIGAAFPVAARFPSAWMPQANTCKPRCPPIYAMHGDKDATVPMAPMQKGTALLREMDFDARFESYPGVAHDFDARMEKDFSEKAKSLLVFRP